MALPIGLDLIHFTVFQAADAESSITRISIIVLMHNYVFYCHHWHHGYNL